MDTSEIILNIRWTETYTGNEDFKINNIIVKKNKKYGIANMFGIIILPIEYDLIVPTEALEDSVSGGLGVIWKNGKCSLVRMSDGKILEPFKFDDIIINNHTNRCWTISSTFLVKENGKYGCVDIYGKNIVPSIYDAIDYIFESNDISYRYKMTLHKDGKIGTYEFCKTPYISGSSVEREQVFSVEPNYDECVFLKNKNAINGYNDLSYIAVRKEQKWGILDNEPESITYFPYDAKYKNIPNIEDLEFKYNSLDDLISDADAEFKRRYNKYYRPHYINEIGGITFVSWNKDS